MSGTKSVIRIALDGTGGDRQDNFYKGIAGSVRFASLVNQQAEFIVFGEHELEETLALEGIERSRYEFRLAPQAIPQDADPKSVLKDYQNSAMSQTIASVRDGEARAVVSAGGTGPLVALSRHILGSMNKLRPALCVRMPAGPGHYTLMLDLGANAEAHAEDLKDFALLGHAASRFLLNIDRPKVALLNVGSESNKGNALIREARDLIKQHSKLDFQGYVEANRIFCGDTDVIVTDGFTGNVALKAAEGVAHIFAHADGIKRFFAKLAMPDWLQPWQYNGALLLGVNGIVVKSHASARQESLAVALVEAVKAASTDLDSAMRRELDCLLNPEA